MRERGGQTDRQRATVHVTKFVHYSSLGSGGAVQQSVSGVLENPPCQRRSRCTEKKMALQKEAVATHVTSSSPATPNITTATSVPPTQTSASLTTATGRPDRITISTAASTTCAIRSELALPEAHNMLCLSALLSFCFV